MIMKIGIFGDSFVDGSYGDKNSTAWWEYLEKEYGHNVDCFGEGGSSISYSAQLILEHYKNYDFIIWAVSNPPRITVRHRKNFKDVSLHITGRHAIPNISRFDLELQEKIKISEEYLVKVYDAHDGNFSSKCIIDYLKNTVPNLMLIPCFIDPWQDTINFNLFDLCQKETNFYFPGVELADLYDQYNDFRKGHLSRSTHKTLSKLIANNLTPGIFRADYTEFENPVELKSEIFIKK